MPINIRLIHNEDTVQNNWHMIRTKGTCKINPKQISRKGILSWKKKSTTSHICLDYDPKGQIL